MTNFKIGIHTALNNSWPARIERYERILRFNNIGCVRLNSDQPDFWDQLKIITGFIFNLVHLDSEMLIANTILPVIEDHFRITCFPDRATRWHYDNKIQQYFLLRSYNFPVVKSWVFWERSSAIGWLEYAVFPLVFKLKSGAGSANVILIKTKKEAIHLVNRMFSNKGVSFGHIPHRNNLFYFRDILKLYRFRRWLAYKRGRIENEGQNPYWQIHRDYILFQKFLPNNKFDLRVTIIGKKAFSFIRYTRPNDFRASGSGRIDYTLGSIDTRCVRIAFEISKKLKFQCMAYDFIYDEHDSPQIAEISYTFVDTAVRNCPGYFDESLKWHDGHFWPQFSILDMLLPEHNLRQPPDVEMQF